METKNSYKEQELIQKFGFDPSEPFQCLGNAKVKHKGNESMFEFYFSQDNNTIDVCHFGCNGTYISGKLTGNKTTLPEEFNEPFLKLKQWYFSEERKEQEKQKAIKTAQNTKLFEKAVKVNAREFAVQYAGGLSPVFSFDGEDPDNPTLPALTLEEAVNGCDRWIGIADTIGGRACIYHVPTKTAMELRFFLQKYRQK